VSEFLHYVFILIAHVSRKLFGNENGAKPCHSPTIECSEDDNMIAMDRQLAARASRSSDTPSAPSSAIDNQQEPCGKSVPPPQRSPTPDLPTAQALVGTREDQQASSVPDLPSPESDDKGPVCKPKQKVIPVCSPTPNPPVNSHKRKQASAVVAIIDDDSPLTEEEPEETNWSAKHGRKNTTKKPRAPSSHKSRRR
jgi:hypothetical protein